MTNGRKQAARKKPAAIVARVRAKEWDLMLYVAGQSPRSLTAIDNLRKICDGNLKGHYQIEVIDLLANPKRCRDDQIVALPTLVRKLPVPIRKIIGDLSDTARTLVLLQVRPHFDPLATVT